MSDSLQPQGLQHFRLLCLSLSPGVCSNSCPLSQWWRPTISSSPPLLLMPLISPSIRVFSNELALHIGGQSMGASASVLPINIQSWFPLGLTASRDARVKNPPSNAGERCEFHLMVEDHLKESMATIPIFLPGEAHEQRSLGGCGAQSHRVLGMTKAT